MLTFSDFSFPVFLQIYNVNASNHVVILLCGHFSNIVVPGTLRLLRTSVPVYAFMILRNTWFSIPGTRLRHF